MDNLRMKRAFAEARISDDPDSPVVRMPLTADKVDGYVRLMAELKETFGRLKAKILEDGVGSADALEVAELQRKVISAAIGADGYDEVVGYLRSGEDVPAEQLNALLSPLMVWVESNMLEMAPLDKVAEVLGEPGEAEPS